MAKKWKIKFKIMCLLWPISWNIAGPWTNIKACLVLVYLFKDTSGRIDSIEILFLDSPEGILRRWLSQYRRHHRLLVCREVPPSGWSTRWTSNMVQRKSTRNQKKGKGENKKWKIHHFNSVTVIAIWLTFTWVNDKRLKLF